MKDSPPETLASSHSYKRWKLIYLLVVGFSVAAIGALYFFSQYFSS